MDNGPRSGYEMRSARRSINLLFADWGNRGLNMWEYFEQTQLLTYGVGAYILDTDSSIVDVIEQVVQLPPGSTGQQTARINMTRVSISTQATRTNPTVTGRPTEVYYHRGVTGMTANVWPLPGSDGPYTLVLHVVKRIQDAGAYTNTADLPFRFLPAFIAGLAYYIAQKKLVGQDQSGYTSFTEQRILRLKQEYEEAWALAADEDREKATLMLVPRPMSYRVA